MSEAENERLAAMVGLTIAAAHLPGVARNLATLLDQAELVMAVPLPAELEPAPVFHADAIPAELTP
jgi:hypothetical protein